MISKWLRGVVGKPLMGMRRHPFPSIAPERPFYAIGDVHGRLDLLQQLLTRLEPSHPLVFVGDYIDRGDYGAQVLRHLQYLDEKSSRTVFCLMGNHEDMLLRFLDEPQQNAQPWMWNGGFETLTSFGIKCSPNELTGEKARRVAGQLRDAMGETLLEWSRARPLTWSSGNVTAVHAALDPTRPVSAQERQVCLWGRGDGFRRPRQDGQWVIHGHTIVDDPSFGDGIISIDTGAFATGRLTAAEIFDGGVRFVTTD